MHDAKGLAKYTVHTEPQTVTMASKNRNVYLISCPLCFLRTFPFCQINMFRIIYTSECAPELDGYGYSVTNTGVAVGSSANYTCWPGYDYVSGNTNRECMSSLVWSGRRPTCKRACTTVYPLYCQNCRFNWNSLVHKCQYTPAAPMPSENCAALNKDNVLLSAYYMDGKCITSDCDINIDDADAASWAFTHSCFDRKYPIVFCRE